MIKYSNLQQFGVILGGNYTGISLPAHFVL